MGCICWKSLKGGNKRWCCNCWKSFKDGYKRWCCLPRNTKELYRHETCCWNHPLANEPRAPCSCAFVLPAGSMAGFVLTVYGYSQFLYFNDIVYEQLLAVGINLTTVIGVDINQFLQEQVYPIPMVTGILIMLFGLREKYRTRFGQCRHDRSCLAAVASTILRGLLVILAILCIFFSLAVLAYAEAIYILLLCTDQACKNAEDAVLYLMELATSNSLIDDGQAASDDQINAACDAVVDVTSASKQAAWSSVIILAGAILLAVYWMKYSTLTLVTAFEDGIATVSLPSDIESDSTATVLHD